MTQNHKEILHQKGIIGNSLHKIQINVRVIWNQEFSENDERNKALSQISH